MTDDAQSLLPHEPDPECDCHDCQKWLEVHRREQRGRAGRTQR